MTSWQILAAKARIAQNALRGIRKHMYVHLFVGLSVVVGLMGGGAAFFHEIFGYLMSQEVFGPPLMDRLVGIVFLAFFSMLIFSNLIITLSTSYISREVDFLMAQPVSYQAIFRQKLIESILYSSWAFAVLSLPFFVSFGISRHAEWHFYPLTAMLVLPYLVIPAAVGALLTMLITAFLPARRTRTLVAALAVLSVALAILLAKVMRIGRMFAQANEGNFMEVMSFLEVGSSPLLPSSWMMRGLLSIAPGDLGAPDLRSYVYWFAMLASTALFLVQAAEWLAPALYYRGWCLSKDSANRSVASHARLSPLALFDRALFWMPRAQRALLSKDMRTFWRDPSQWTQLVILFGLMVIYIANLRSAQRYSATVEFLLTEWKTILAFFNLGATCFILSILTTRFVYPMLSLEGRQFWTIGLAPMKRSAIVWQKYVLCVSSSLVFAMSLLALSNAVLQVEPALQAISVATIAVLALGLSSLSIGIGAFLPNFREDNPARIANGLGGTANALLSLAYIGVTIIMLAPPVNFHLRGLWDRFAWWQTWRIPYMTAFVLLQATAIVAPLWLGLRRWNRLEF